MLDPDGPGVQALGSSKSGVVRVAELMDSEPPVLLVTKMLTTPSPMFSLCSSTVTEISGSAAVAVPVLVAVGAGEGAGLDDAGEDDDTSCPEEGCVEEGNAGSVEGNAGGGRGGCPGDGLGCSGAAVTGP